ncbi:unnamed protein product (macronuclear) [Paramecium tetraurelia]|uniref:Mini antigen n=1 Tax=Paramecium tetraurelia TaxID=5888 RepID=A0C0C3_PARTE|nr:uncharacterized protein GSPATT00006093001 [Paramecium tetraurelia]CAK64240.1 unnamed protein product [Paramecium tetraurelia]|eukprot:XP_001431638.1 hypothetical protein (macronuclear) [Paramecium tetraurelia strain d4-2]
MFIFFHLIVLAIQFTIKVDQVSCTCPDIPQEDICIETKVCKWEDGSCQKLNCTDATDQEWCDRILPNSYKCAWNQGKCDAFTACSDYIVSKPQECFEKWFCADGGLTASGLYACTDLNTDDTDEGQEIICQDVKIEEECVGLQQDGNYCIWDSTAQNCNAIGIESCGDASNTTQEYCRDTSCEWSESNNECMDLSCDLFKSEDKCNLYFSFDLSEVTRCLWNGTSCLDFDITELPSEQCLNMTLNTYVWNSVQSRCVECAESLILKLTLILILIYI